MTTLRWLAAAGAACAMIAAPLSAQPVISAKSGTISWVEGKVFVGDDPVEQSATKFPDIKENAVLRTELGRAEVLLTPGVVMHVGENSSFRMITKRLIDTRLELLTGSAMVSAVEIAKDTNVTVVCKDGTVLLSKAGHYRFDADPARLKVYAGLANVEIVGQHIEVGAGKMLSLGSDTAVEKFNKEDTDSLDNWAYQRDQLMAMANVSTARAMYNGYSSPGSGVWGWNPYLGLYTYIPGSGRFCDPFYGFCYWSPYTVGRFYYQPGFYNYGGGGYRGPSSPTTAANSTGYSRGMAAESAGHVGAGSTAVHAAAASGGMGGSGAMGHGGGAAAGRGR